MARIEFIVEHRFEQSARTVWDDMVDWETHAEWIPMTRVKVGDGASTDVGHEFTAWTGPGRLSLEDRMRVVRCDWDDATGSGDCEVEKLGPILRGRAGFTIEPDGSGSQLRWFEDVNLPRVPQFLAPVVAKVGAVGFKQGMKSLGKRLTAASASGV